MKVRFLAPEPPQLKSLDGYMRRVAGVNELFGCHDTTFIDGFRADHETFLPTLLDSDVIYIHSIYQVQAIKPHLRGLAGRIIVDLHGVVPEEQQYLGNVRAASQFQAIEKQVFHTCYNFVAVSEAMVEHYHAKYGSTSRKANWVLLPLTSPICADIDERSTDDSELVVYSGGSQKWQNVEMMIAAIRNSCDRYRFEIITQTPEAFDSISDRALVRTIAAEEVNKVYKRSGLGFLLRDDTVVNRVALPTKLIEYVSCGVVPIMLSDKLGDARSVGIAFARLEDFAADKIDSTQLAIARSANLNAIKRLNEQSQAGRKALLDICSTIASGADKDYGLRHAKRDARKQMILDELTRLPGRAIRAPRKLLRILRGDSLETKEI